jgi:hypothetical protein
MADLTRYSLREVAEAIVCEVLDVYGDLPKPYGAEGGLALGNAVIDALAEMRVRVVVDGAVEAGFKEGYQARNYPQRRITDDEAWLASKARSAE